MKELVFATHNQNKIAEVRKLLPSELRIISLYDLGCFEEIPETQNTIEGNAAQKANYIHEKYGYSCFADDTGLLVESLNGEPGVRSARYAGTEKNPEANMQKLLAELKSSSNRLAHFKTVIALNLNGNIHNFTGICKGEILKEKRGVAGFGYDPIFMPNGFNQTFAEMTLDQKNTIGHRGQAVRKLNEFIKHNLELLN